MIPFAAVASFTQEAILTAYLVVVLVCLSSCATWAVSRHQSSENQRFWRLTFRNIAALAFLLGVAIIWKSELQSLFLALGAATAGFLVAFKESWLSLLAFWVRVVKRQYSLNDFIEIDGVRGKVIDITWLNTIVAESVPGKGGTIYSGKVIHIPNNRMLLSSLAVDNLTDDFALHIITIPLPRGARPLAAEKTLLEVAGKHCAPYYAEAREHMKQLAVDKALEISSVEPRSFLSVGDEGCVTIRMRIVVPEAERGRLHQAILHDFFASVDETSWPFQLPAAA